MVLNPLPPRFRATQEVVDTIAAIYAEVQSLWNYICLPGPCDAHIPIVPDPSFGTILTARVELKGNGKTNVSGRPDSEGGC